MERKYEHVMPLFESGEIFCCSLGARFVPVIPNWPNLAT